MIIPSHLPPKTEVVFVDGEGNEVPAYVERAGHSGQFYLAFDADGNNTTVAAFSDEPLPGTFHFKRDPADASATTKKQFAPGKKNGAEAPAA